MDSWKERRPELLVGKKKEDVWNMDETGVFWRALPDSGFGLTKIDECQTASEVLKSVNILIALRWVAQAWSMVTVRTISKCFRRAGILDSEMDIVSCNMEEDDPFLAVNEEADFVSLMNDVVPISCSSVEYVSGEDDIPVCNDLDSLTWEEYFVKHLVRKMVEKKTMKIRKMIVCMYPYRK